MLSSRLQMIFDMIDYGSKVINIGTDHALLEIALTKEKNVFCIGSDINPYSIQKSLKNIEKAGLKDKIFLVVSDGLENLQVQGEVIILSGLGTQTILKILENEKAHLASKIIIQSNNNLEALRKRMGAKGYKIEKEKVVFENGYWYVAICFVLGVAQYVEEEYCFGVFIDDKNYYRHLLSIYQKTLQKIPCSAMEKRKSILHKILYLKEKSF